ncbi:CD209 antigen-like isoform X2 [Scophthalmus maximus]|uniref:CD209 antigen-like isoform X2 n=1 Tax=Scophthalmus maximus TaxID=52904 RepID=UPI0015E10F36|nr:CD209 antigen-like isoform X2 [Scophthalmus maximus]
MGYPEMNSYEDESTDGKSFHHNPRSRGSVYTVRFGSRSLPLYPLVIVCLGLLNTILLSTAVAIGIYCSTVDEESSPHQISAPALILEQKELKILRSEVIKALKEYEQALEKELRSHEQLNLQMEQNKTLSDSLQTRLETLHVEKAILLSETSEIRESCGRCLPGWFLLNTSCYFHSKSGSLKTWTDSREDCKSRGADLVVIDNLEEQVNLFDHLPKMNSGHREWWKESGIWIGITDHQAEGTWVWVNNMTLLDGGYWIQGEPNNYGSQGEDCGAIVNIDNPRRSWFDGFCQSNREWLCEMGPS